MVMSSLRRVSQKGSKSASKRFKEQEREPGGWSYGESWGTRDTLGESECLRGMVEAVGAGREGRG